MTRYSHGIYISFFFHRVPSPMVHPIDRISIGKRIELWPVSFVTRSRYPFGPLTHFTLYVIRTTTIDQYVTTLDSQVIFLSSFSPKTWIRTRLTYRFRLLSRRGRKKKYSSHKSCWMDSIAGRRKRIIIVRTREKRGKKKTINIWMYWGGKKTWQYSHRVWNRPHTFLCQ